MHTSAGWLPYVFTRWRLGPPFFGFGVVRIVGVLLIATVASGVNHSFLNILV